MSQSSANSVQCTSSLRQYSCEEMRANSSLRAVLMLTRHGVRMPLGSYPKDPHNESNWLEGIGTLTTKGKEQLKTSGKVKASRYRFLLENSSGQVDLKRFTVLSSYIQRSVDSAKQFVDGFLETTTWPPDFIKVIPKEDDQILSVQGDTRATYREAFHQSFRTDQPAMQSHFKNSEEYEEFLEYVAKCSGLQGKSLTTIFLLDDIMTIQLDHGLKLPDWAESAYEKYIHPMGNTLYQTISANDYMQKRSQNLLEDMLKRFEDHLQGSNERVVLYSAHDLTISGLLIRLNTDHPRPDCGSTLAIELHDSPLSNDGLEIKLFFFTCPEDRNPIELKIPNYSDPCSFRKFKEAVSSQQASRL